MPNPCQSFHSAIEKYVVPVVVKELERRKRLLGVDTLRPWDLSVDPEGHEPLRGREQVGTVEERPGIPATPSHIVKLVSLMKEDRVKAIVAEPWSDLKLIQRIAQEAGAQTAILAATVGAVKGTDTFIEAVDFNVKTLAQVLK